MDTLGTCLWFDDQAEEAARFYVSIFPNSKIVATSRYPEGVPGPRPAGSVMTVQFVLNGRDFMGLNGGPQFTFSPAISLVVPCDTQEEVDELWKKLTEGGQEVECGWLTDRFGLSWQIVPKEFFAMMSGPDKTASARAVHAMLGMKKLDLPTLRRAYENG